MGSEIDETLLSYHTNLRREKDLRVGVLNKERIFVLRFLDKDLGDRCCKIK